jgi:2-polyprenyl-3-methyl-5-hydroxy-6-metoxy-1,4-benzoquinol methylase
VQKSIVSYRQQQEEVNAYFHAHSSYWKDIYAGSGVQAEIYRDRQSASLAWIDGLALAPGSRVLEIGCGAGFLSVALANRGLRVHAIDSAEAMVELARRHAQDSGTAGLLSVEIGDVYALPFEDDAFDLVVTLGVVPWLARPELAIAEMARVTAPGGHVILSADNRSRLIYLLDPWKNPALAPFRGSVRGLLERIGLLRGSRARTQDNLYDCRFIDETLARAGLIKSMGMTLGFGPFTFMNQRILSNSLARALHRRLQHLADRNVPAFRSSGSQYIVLAGKSASQAP